MKKHLPTFLIVLLIFLSWVSSLNLAFSSPFSQDSENYEFSYTFAVQNDYYTSDHTLHVSLPPSLREYYSWKNHVLNNADDFANFVTPDAVKSVAEDIRSVIRNTSYDDEEFANAVLMIVHSITFVARSETKYPVETIADNMADCDGLSILAASLLKAGGLDVVLLLYKATTPQHMNIGVSLEQMPVSHSSWIQPSGIEYNNKTYWISECTALADWRVGNQPEILACDNPQVIPLDNCEKESPAHVSSSLDTRMQPSSVSINLCTEYSDVTTSERIIEISGGTLPVFPNGNVTIYFFQLDCTPTAIVVDTDEFGNYSLLWNVSWSGTYGVKASWSGFSNYSGSDSDPLTVFIDARQPTIKETVVSSPDYQLHAESILSRYDQQFLKTSFAGTKIILSGDFMVLSYGHEVTPNDATITIATYERVYGLPISQQTIMQEYGKTLAFFGADEFSRQFSFMLTRNMKGNYTADVRMLSDDTKQITWSLEQNRTPFLNVSYIARKTFWYKAIATLSSNKAVVEIHDENGALLDRNENNDISELNFLVNCPTGQVLVFKNLRVETVDEIQSSVPVSSQQNQVSSYAPLYPYVRILLLLVGAVQAIIYLRGRKAHAEPF